MLYLSTMSKKVNNKNRAIVHQTLSWSMFCAVLCMVIAGHIFNENAGLSRAIAGLVITTVLVFLIERKATFTQALTDRISMCTIMVLLAIFVMLGTFSHDFALGYQKDILTGLFSILSATLIHYTIQLFPNKKGVRGYFLILSHLGAIVLIAGSAISSALSNGGFINLSTKGESYVYFELKNSQPTGKVHQLPEPISLQKFRTDYHDKDLLLYVYKKRELIQVHSVTKNLNVKIGESDVKVKSLFHDLAKEKTVTPSLKATGISAIHVALNTPEGKDQDWLTTSSQSYGFIRKNAQNFLVKFYKNKNQITDKISDSELWLNAEDATWKVINSNWQPLPQTLEVTLGERHILVDQFIKEADVKIAYKNASNKLKNPAVEFEITGVENKNVWLSPLLPKPLILENEYAMRLAISADEPKYFESSILLSGTEHKISVNKPVRSGFCRIYQADFDKDNDNFSGLRITCDPGAPVFKFGAFMILIGLLGCALLPSRRFKA